MKKIIVTMAIAISSLSAIAMDGSVNQKVLDAFKTEFESASEVEWTIGSDYYKASFNYNGKYVFAFFNENGEMLGMTRHLSPLDLPLALQGNLKKNYEGFWISELFEAVKSDETSYYVTIENADNTIILQSSGKSWSVYKKTKKS
jgi:hypothetical protein